MRKLLLDGVEINDDSDCYFIAEIGCNHQGDIGIAKRMVDVAVECGVDAVKLQKRDNRALFTKKMYNMPYDNRNSFGNTYGEHREALEFDYDEFTDLFNYINGVGVSLIVTPFDFNSADFLYELGVSNFKISSFDATNIPFVKYIAKFGKTVFVSTGGCVMEDVYRVYNAIRFLNNRVCLMQCTSGYPCTEDELDLKVISTYRDAFPNTVIGLSCHESGIAMPIVAYTLGARVIEMHFTLNRSFKGTDHAFSLGIGGLSKVVRDLRKAKRAFGDGIKKKYDIESGPFKLGKKLVAARDLKRGHILRRDDIEIKSPNDGIPPYMLYSIIGKEIPVDIEEDENIVV
jgi:N-acetylneuraminate synthase/sialic acid synthase